MASLCRRQQCTIERRGFRQELDSWRHKLIHCVGFESILEGLFGSGLVEDLTLFKDCEPEGISDWSFDENCLFCCLRRDKVKEHLVGLSNTGLQSGTNSLLVKDHTKIIRLEKQAEEFLNAVLYNKDVPSFSDPHIPVVAREIMQRMIRQFAAEYTSKTNSSSQDSRAAPSPAPRPPLPSLPPAVNPGATAAASVPNQNPVLSKLLMADQDSPLDLTVKKPSPQPVEQDGVLDLSLKKGPARSSISSLCSPQLTQTSALRGESLELSPAKARDLQATSTLEQFMAKLCLHHQKQIVDALGFLQTEVNAISSSSTSSISTSQPTCLGEDKAHPGPCHAPCLETPAGGWTSQQPSLASTPKGPAEKRPMVSNRCSSVVAPQQNPGTLSGVAGPDLNLCQPGPEESMVLSTQFRSTDDGENKRLGDHAPLKIKILKSNSLTDGNKLSCVLATSTLDERQGNLNSLTRADTYHAGLGSSVKRQDHSNHSIQKGCFGQTKDKLVKQSPLQKKSNTITPIYPRTARKTIKGSSYHRPRFVADPDLGHCDIVYINKPITECFQENQHCLLPRRNARKSTRGHMYVEEMWELKTVRTLAGKSARNDTGNCPTAMPELITLVTPKQVLGKPEGVPLADIPFVGGFVETVSQKTPSKLSTGQKVSGDVVASAASNNELEPIVETSQTDQRPCEEQTATSQCPLLENEQSERTNPSLQRQSLAPEDSLPQTLVTSADHDVHNELVFTGKPEHVVMDKNVNTEQEKTEESEHVMHKLQCVPEGQNVVFEIRQKDLKSLTPSLESTGYKEKLVVSAAPQKHPSSADQNQSDFSSGAEKAGNESLTPRERTELPETGKVEHDLAQGVESSLLEEKNVGADSSSKHPVESVVEECITNGSEKQVTPVLSIPVRLKEDTVTDTDNLIICGYVNGRPVAQSDRCLRDRPSKITTESTPTKSKRPTKSSLNEKPTEKTENISEIPHVSAETPLTTSSAGESVKSPLLKCPIKGSLRQTEKPSKSMPDGPKGPLPKAKLLKSPVSKRPLRVPKVKTSLSLPETSPPPPDTSLSPPVTSQPPPETSEPPPEISQPPPESSQPPPETSQPPPETSKPPPESSQPPLETSQPPPETSQPPPETSLPPPDTSPPSPDTSPPSPDTSQPPPDTSPSPPETSQPRPEISQPPPETSQPPPETSQPPPETSQPPPEISQPPPEISQPPPDTSPPLPNSSPSSPESSPPPPEASPPLPSALPPLPGASPPLPGDPPSLPGSPPPLHGASPPPPDALPPVADAKLLFPDHLLLLPGASPPLLGTTPPLPDASPSLPEASPPLPDDSHPFTIVPCPLPQAYPPLPFASSHVEELATFLVTSEQSTSLSVTELNALPVASSSDQSTALPQNTELQVKVHPAKPKPSDIQNTAVETRMKTRPKLRSSMIIAKEIEVDKAVSQQVCSHAFSQGTDIKDEGQSSPLRSKVIQKKEAEASKLSPSKGESSKLSHLKNSEVANLKKTVEKSASMDEKSPSGDSNRSSIASSDKPGRMPLRSESTKSDMAVHSVNPESRKSCLRVQRSPAISAPVTIEKCSHGITEVAPSITVKSPMRVSSPIKLKHKKNIKSPVRDSLLFVSSPLPSSSITPVLLPKLEPPVPTRNKFLDLLDMEENQHKISSLNTRFEKMHRGWVQLDKEGHPTPKHKNKSDRQAAIWKSRRRVRKPKSSDHQRLSLVQMLFKNNLDLTSICHWYMESTETQSLVIIKKVNTRLPTETQLLFPGMSQRPSQQVFPSLQAERLKKHLKKFAIASPVKNNARNQKLIAKALAQEVSTSSPKGKEKRELTTATRISTKAYLNSADTQVLPADGQKAAAKAKNPTSARILRKYSNIREKMQGQQSSKNPKGGPRKELEASKVKTPKPLTTKLEKPTKLKPLTAKRQKLSVSGNESVKELGLFKTERAQPSPSRKAAAKAAVQERPVKTSNTSRTLRDLSKKASAPPLASSQRVMNTKAQKNTLPPATTLRIDSNKKQVGVEKASVGKTALTKADEMKLHTARPSQSRVFEPKVTGSKDAESNIAEIVAETQKDIVKTPGSPDQVLTRSQRKMEATPSPSAPQSASPKLAAKKASDPTQSQSGTKSAMKRPVEPSQTIITSPKHAMNRPNEPAQIGLTKAATKTALEPTQTDSGSPKATAKRSNEPAQSGSPKAVAKRANEPVQSGSPKAVAKRANEPAQSGSPKAVAKRANEPAQSGSPKAVAKRANETARSGSPKAVAKRANEPAQSGSPKAVAKRNEESSPMPAKRTRTSLQK